MSKVDFLYLGFFKQYRGQCYFVLEVSDLWKVLRSLYGFIC